MALHDFSYSAEENALVKKYIMPKRIIISHQVDNSGLLLEDLARQTIATSGLESCTIEDGGYVLLDFGSELQGGIDLSISSITAPSSNGSSASAYGTARIVFGESVSEALSEVGADTSTNDHAVRDMTVRAVPMSTLRYGNTGFRFVKIQAIGCKLHIRAVKGVLEYRNIEYKGSFRCSDERLNQIFDTAAYTVHLNMQDYVWDGIKRDRLVWIGDLHPELSTICAVFGHDKSVEKTLDFSKAIYAADKQWMVFPSYTCWWIKCHRDWYLQNGNLAYLSEQKDYLYTVSRRLLDCIGEDGTLLFDNNYFVDWSSNKTPYMEAGFRGCLILGLDAAAELFTVFSDDAMAAQCREAIANVKKIVPVHDGNKQACAMAVLSDLVGLDCVDTILMKNMPKGLSTFYGYYVLCALAKAGKIQDAVDVIRTYWGGMLDSGATTFWEDFDIEWLDNAGRIDELPSPDKVDIHAAYGKFCYIGLRHSLCHGWASGPAPFLAKYVLGVQVLEPGCKTVKIAPCLGDLEWVKGTYPTPYGIIEIEHRKENGTIKTKVNAPAGVTITE